MQLQRYFRRHLSRATETGHYRLLQTAQAVKPQIRDVATEWGFYLAASSELSAPQQAILHRLHAHSFDPLGFGTESYHAGDYASVVEIGPRLAFETFRSSETVALLHQLGLTQVSRMERTLRIAVDCWLSPEERQALAAPLMDRMTQMVYDTPLLSFDTGITPEPVQIVPLLEEGRDALDQINKKLGLGLSPHVSDLVLSFFQNVLKRNPTDVEVLKIAILRSEHSRHDFFRSLLYMYGVPLGTTLLDLIKMPWRVSPGVSNNAFGDNASSLFGGPVTTLLPHFDEELQRHIYELRRITLCPTCTCETHNHPTGVCPYGGAPTGNLGRRRDTETIGRGGMGLAGMVGYMTAYFVHPDLTLPWPAPRPHPAHLASPLDIFLTGSTEVSNAANCLGEPLIAGWWRCHSGDTPHGYRAHFKPILYAGGIGHVDERHVTKNRPEAGMLIVEAGGPAYDIGFGGGPASSMMTGESAVELDWHSVQRANAAMALCLDRSMQECCELGDDNPFEIVHDEGAGGVGSAAPEAAYPLGARIYLRRIPLGDKSLSTLKVVGNESQERNIGVLRKENWERAKAIFDRNRCPLTIIGEVTDDGHFVLYDENDGSTPVNLPVELLLGDAAPKRLDLARSGSEVAPKYFAELPPRGVTILEALKRILQDPAVCSRRHLSSKVDDSVTGRVAARPRTGPNNIPLTDYGIAAHSLFDVSGVATAIGERPLIGIMNPAAMGRMALAEGVLNLAGAYVGELKNVRCSVNCMWAAKLPGEAIRLYECYKGLSDLLLLLGCAGDGGKDSLTMAAKTRDEIIAAIGQIVITLYAQMPNVNLRVSPECKKSGNHLLLLDLSGRGQLLDGAMCFFPQNGYRMGGSVIAQVYNELQLETPDVDDPALLARGFAAIQKLVAEQLIVAAHDRSDGGLITTLCEMAFAGNRGVAIDLTAHCDSTRLLFSEELGMVVEVAPEQLQAAETILAKHFQIPIIPLGTVGELGGNITIRHNGTTVIDEAMVDLRAVWDHTSAQLESIFRDPACAASETRNIRDLVQPPNWHLTFTPELRTVRAGRIGRDRVAVLRTNGTNGDREMAAAFKRVGFHVDDIHMTDLLSGRAAIDERYVGLGLPGGFANGDIPDTAIGWALLILENPRLAEQLTAFCARSETFSLGICNGAQVSTLLGLTKPQGLATPDIEKDRFVLNQSGHFESRVVTAAILDGPAVAFRNMAGSRIGVKASHCEGRARLAQPLAHASLAPIRYVHPVTGELALRVDGYPWNPNGSQEAIAGLCDPSGRHLATMLHMERWAHAHWEWDWQPEHWAALAGNPWLEPFHNLFAFAQGD